MFDTSHRNMTPEYLDASFTYYIYITQSCPSVLSQRLQYLAYPYRPIVTLSQPFSDPSLLSSLSRWSHPTLSLDSRPFGRGPRPTTCAILSCQGSLGCRPSHSTLLLTRSASRAGRPRLVSD
ncbi:hypothetical protein BD310DRAFT_923456 [Dichomitus squalens]|uniref:Uncharacterized protein n=1 Tax=Dichomitus squalens TaxID=114155 RepID=A0A4Q9PZN7_9APHY|nr:hypothetical protein BD310DRAFT_923456 [Dichomitus squalens]